MNAVKAPGDTPTTHWLERTGPAALVGVVITVLVVPGVVGLVRVTENIRLLIVSELSLPFAVTALLLIASGGLIGWILFTLRFHPLVTGIPAVVLTLLYLPYLLGWRLGSRLWDLAVTMQALHPSTLLIIGVFGSFTVRQMNARRSMSSPR